MVIKYKKRPKYAEAVNGYFLLNAYFMGQSTQAWYFRFW